jgi:hypothetical protein
MKTTVTNQQVIALINRAFDPKGFLVKSKRRRNQKEAREILENENEESYYGKLVNGLEAHNCLLIIAYPDHSL